MVNNKKDITEKTLEDYNDVFADIVNGLLFGGEQVVQEDELLPVPTKSQYKADDDEIHEQERDVSKLWKDVTFTVALIGIENQTEQDSDMIFRVLGYDGASYRSQIYAGNERYPVITLVLYFGYESRWNQRTLYDRLDVPDELKEYVSDYRMNVFEIAYLEDEVIERFSSDFGIVARCFSQLRKNGKYEPTVEEIKHVDEVLKLMKVLTGDDRFRDTQNTERLSRKGGSTTMIDIIGGYIAKGEAIGEARGEVKAYRKMGLSDEEIAEKMDKTVDEVREILNEKEAAAS